MQNTELYLTLIANVIIDAIKDYSRKNKKIRFKESDCIGFKGIRFSTISLDNLFPPIGKNIGCFKNGHFAYYEISIIDSFVEIHLNVSKIDLNYLYYAKLAKLNVIKDNKTYATLYSAKLAGIQSDNISIRNAITSFLDGIDNIELIALKEKEADNSSFKEGSMYEALDVKYERNIEARNKCLEYYGTKCMICGYDSKKVFGEDTKPIIEVHHIVPISYIKEEYEVDPIKDLIPVCPNCHAFIHSKDDGVYTIDEVKEIIKKKG